MDSAIVTRTQFLPTKYSKVCSLHFVDEDLITETEGSNVRRRKPNTPLKKRKLRSDAVPSIFSNMPKYFTLKKSIREKNALLEPSTSTAKRREKDKEWYYEIENAFFESDRVSTLNDIKLKLDTEEIVPDAFLKHTTDSWIVFVQLDTSDRQTEVIKVDSYRTRFGFSKV